MSTREIKDLVEQLQQARTAYYNSDPIMSDVEYDALEDELRELDPDNALLKQIGPKVQAKTKFKKVKHEVPMGSLMKVQTIEEFKKWAKDTLAKIDAAERSGDLKKGTSRKVVVSDKLDGISLSRKDTKGKFVQAVTRGQDGTEGKDISRNVRLMKGFVTTTKNLTAHIRSEIILRKSDHKKHVPEMKNRRNGANGIAKRESDPTACKHLTIIAYQIISDQHKIPTKSAEFKLLKALGFEVPTWKVMNLEDVEAYYEEYIKSKRDALDYDIDGLVIEFDALSIMDHLGDHDDRPKGARAFKFPHAEQKSRLRAIVWQVGNSGRITPVAYFDTVDLAGASVSQASLHNVSNVRRLAANCPQQLLGLSDLILVSRRNDVIPYVEKVIKPSNNARFATPTECPSCSKKLKMNGEYLMCNNHKGCPAQQSGAIKRWISKLDIKDWGEGLIEAVCENGMVKTIPDLYSLDEEELAAVKMSGKRVGKSTATKVMKNLRAKMELRIEDFVGSLGIHLWGRSMVKMIAAEGIDTLEKMEDATVGQIARVPRVGETKAVSFVDGLGRSQKLIDGLLAAGITIRAPVSGGKLKGVSVCFTGVRDKALMAQIEDAGGQVKSGVGKGLTYLVAADPKSTSGKAKKARAQGTKVISVAEAKALL